MMLQQLAAELCVLTCAAVYSRIEGVGVAEGEEVRTGETDALTVAEGLGLALMRTPLFQTLLAPLFTQVKRFP